MFSIPHLILIFVIVLIAFGPEKLPQLARTLGKAMAEFRKITGDLRRVVDDEMREIERQTREAEIRNRDAAAQASLPGAPATPAVAPALAAAPLPDEHVIAPPAAATTPAPSIAPPGTIASTPPNGRGEAQADEPASIAETIPTASEPIPDAKS
jgi:sec-independent protein translocase protein TatB